MTYLDTVKTFLENATDLNTLNEIREELSDGRYLKSVIKSKKMKKHKINITRLASEEGYEILFGKNNLENEYVTFKLADKNDMWLHAKDIPGSHVVIKNMGDGFTNRVIEEAAIIAAKNSKLKDETKVLVDYTLKKICKKAWRRKTRFCYIHTRKVNNHQNIKAANAALKSISYIKVT